MEKICIEDRKKLDLCGATRMISSTSTQAVVELSADQLVISGNNIEITKLDLENKEVSFSGDFVSVKFSQKAEKTNIFKRLFK